MSEFSKQGLAKGGPVMGEGSSIDSKTIKSITHKWIKKQMKERYLR